MLGKIYEAFVEHRPHVDNLPALLDRMRDHFRDRPELEEVGGTAFLFRLAKDAAGTKLDQSKAAAKIAELARMRVVAAELQELASAVRMYDEIMIDPVFPGAGRVKAHALAVVLIGVAQVLLHRSRGWP